MLRFVSKLPVAVLMVLCVSAISFPTASVADGGSLTWTQTEEGPQYWSAIAASYDGSKLVAASVTGNPTPPEAYHGRIYTSVDSGVTWTLRHPTVALVDWQSVASSSDGQKLVICWTNFDAEGEIYTSVDSGVTWQLTSAPARNWVTVTSSADGNKLAAAARGDETDNAQGEIYTSVDAGATWVLRASAGLRQWSSIASDSSGNKLVAVDRRNEFVTPNRRGFIYTSSNAGLTWIEHDAPLSAGLETNTENQSWNSVSSNGDGTRLVAGGLSGLNSFGGIFTSSDSGETWIENSPIQDRWASVSTSNSGKIIIASPIGGRLYVSNNYGETWTAQTSIEGYPNWTTSIVSRDGSLLIAGENNDSQEPGGYLWTTSLPAEPNDDSDAVAEAARVAAAAEAARVNAAVREAARKVAIEKARIKLLQEIQDNKPLVINSYLSADIEIPSTRALDHINKSVQAIQAKTPDKQLTLEVIKAEVLKETVIDRLANPATKNSVNSLQLVSVGLLDLSYQNKTSVMLEIKRLPSADLNSYEKVQAVIAEQKAAIQARKDRLAKSSARIRALVSSINK